MKISRLFAGDKIIWVVFFLLSIISLVSVYSSIGLYAYSAFAGRTPTSLFLRHLLIVVVTYAAVIWISHVNYRYLSRFAVLGYWATLVLLVLMLALSRGRWMSIPVIGTFQPSEIAKVVLVIFVARFLALKKDEAQELGTFLRVLVFIGGMVVFILPENFSMAALIAFVCYLMMYFGGINRTYWWRVFGVLALAVVIGLAVSYIHYERTLNAPDDAPQTEESIGRSKTWGHRLYSWMNPDYDDLTQENMSRMAIARGGVLGVGVGNTVHARLMTQAHNDFIFAIILEETGMVGGLLVFSLYAIFYFRCIKISWRCKGRFGALMVAGLSTMIYLQALLNMCVAVGVLPVTGQTLPFISYGGTAYLFLGCGLGIIQSVAADVNKKEQEAGQPVPSVAGQVNEQTNNTSE